MSYTHLSLHPNIHIRVVDASAKDLRVVMSQIGAAPSEPVASPDVVVCFVPSLALNQPVRHLVMGSAGFTDDAFVGCAGEHKARVPLERIGGTVEITCEAGASSIPLLMWVIHLAALAKDIMPLHASAFRYQGHGVIASGWPKGGKTSSLFAFLAHDAQFVSDDWLYVDPDGLVYGVPQPIKLSDWQLSQLPQINARVSARKRQGIRAARALDALQKRVPDRWRTSFAPAAIFHQVARYANKKQRHVYLDPRHLFAQDTDAAIGRFETLLLTLSHESQDILINETPLEEAVERLTFLLLHEWQEFLDVYLQYRYAFPHRRIDLVDQLADHQRRLLTALMQNKQILTVQHPHPVSLDALFRALVSRILA